MRRVLVASALLASLSGCTLIPDYFRPGLPVSDSYPSGPAFGGPGSVPGNVAGVPAASLGWRDFFTDPVMQDLITLSLENNRDLRVAALNVSAAEAQYRIQHASLFPTIDATASGDFEREPAGATGSSGALHINAYSLGLGAASYELDVFGRLRSLSRQAQERYLSSAETQLSTQIGLVASVASYYLAWLADRDAIRVSTDTAKAQQRSYDLERLILSQGSGTASDVAQAESTLRTAQASLEQYTRQAAQDLDQIVLLVGAPLPPDLQTRMMAQAGLGDKSVFPVLPAGLPSDLLTRRPDIRAAEHTLLAANANIGAARAAFFPSVVLTGSGGTTSGTLGSLFGAGTASWLFQPQISVPIFDAGSNFANLDYAKLQKRIEIANYEKAIQSAFHDVADALAARATYTRQVDAQTKLVAADTRFFNISQLRVNAGVDTYLNELVAQSSLFGAQLNLVSLRLAEQQNLVTLYKALGGGWTDRTKS
ncbi:efflux transporter outer membrane subunit [Acidisphaera sp. L21]|uniref:efflux transporter outer membrane subunit n=1 Tax=Acidisphaera sp. L21 TaxID=1641851 RepID=UPI00131B354A|nr:efflux transporter outer membrane subunit [Acidisphaera sp. L21]